MTTEIKIKGHIQNTDGAKEIFDEVISNIEKHYEKFHGVFTVRFENLLGFPHKSQTEHDTSLKTKA